MDDDNTTSVPPLEEDNDTPFSPPTPPPATDQDDNQMGSGEDNEVKDLDPTHPATDTGVQPEEVYQDGLSGAAGVNEPNKDNAVTDYNNPMVDDTNDLDEDDDESTDEEQRSL